MTQLALELAIEAFEGALAPELDSHGAAVVAALRAGARPPPWPSRLLDGRAARLARDAAALGEPVLAARAATMARWSLAARVAGDRDVRAAGAEPRTLDGLAARHDALRAAAPRAGCAEARALIGALYGAAPARVELVGDRDAALVEGRAAEDERAAWPSIAALRDMLAAHAGTPAARIAIVAPCAVNATVIGRGGPTCLIAAPIESAATLALAAHELGHGVYAAGFAGLPLGLAAPPSRLVDEAVAAWAVRRVAPARARRAAAVHARLARFEARALGGEGVVAAWAAELGDRDPAALPSLFDEPGVAIAYARADALALAPGPGELARWAARGAAFDPMA